MSSVTVTVMYWHIQKLNYLNQIFQCHDYDEIEVCQDHYMNKQIIDNINNNVELINNNLMFGYTYYKFNTVISYVVVKII